MAGMLEMLNLVLLGSHYTKKRLRKRKTNRPLRGEELEFFEALYRSFWKDDGINEPSFEETGHPRVFKSYLV
ncbi:hypothetical protein HAX54_019822, partial [Datura stramonium]|nr:hypothetical protein [Datura stramonium]